MCSSLILTQLKPDTVWRIQMIKWRPEFKDRMVLNQSRSDLGGGVQDCWRIILEVAVWCGFKGEEILPEHCLDPLCLRYMVSAMENKSLSVSLFLSLLCVCGFVCVHAHVCAFALALGSWGWVVYRKAQKIQISLPFVSAFFFFLCNKILGLFFEARRECFVIYGFLSGNYS